MSQIKKQSLIVKTFIVIAILLATIAIGTLKYLELKPTLDTNKKYKELRSYNQEIKNCANKKQKETEIIGFELECAIDIAADFYLQDKEKAINLCILNNSVFKLNPYEDYSEDPFSETLLRTTKSTCENLILDQISKNNNAYYGN